jgi:hypothetical protein
MEKETLILQELFIPILQKDERFEESKCDSFFWNKVTAEFINFEQDKKPFYASIYSLNLVNVEQVLNKLESLLNPFLDQIAETYVQGYSSNTTQKLSKVSHYFNERVLFYNNLKKAIFLSERKRIKSELPTMYEKYTFEIDEKQLVEAITKIERQALRDKMKVWDEELIQSNSDLQDVKFSLSSEEKLINFEETNENAKVISFSWVKYAVAACFVLGLGFWFYTSQNQMVVPDNPVVTQPNGDSNSLEAPKPTLVESTTNTQVTDVLVNEGLGFSNASKQVKIIKINNSKRISSIQRAIELYQNFIEKELITSKDDGIKNKSLHIEIKKEIETLQIELNSLKSKHNAYLFDGKALTLYDIEQTKITVLAFENDYYLKKGNDFYKLTQTVIPQKYTKLNNNSLKESLEQILFTNGE